MSASPSPEPPPPRPSDHADALTVFGVVTLLALVAIQMSRQPGTVATLWLANGAAVGLIASAPRSRMPLLLAMAALGNLTAHLGCGDALGTALAFAARHTVEVALGAWLLHRAPRTADFASDVRSFLQVQARGALLPPLLGATLGAAALQGLGSAPFERVWVDGYIDAAAGAAAMLPLVLSLRAAAGLQHGHQPPARLGALRWLLVLPLVAGATALALHTWHHPFVVVAVGLTVVAFTQARLLVLASAPVVGATLAVCVAWGWYRPPGSDSVFGHAQLHLSLLLVVLAAQVLAVALARQRALADLLAAVGSRDDHIVVVTDAAGTYRWVNRARERYHGVPASAVLGRKVRERAGARDDEAELVAAFDSALKRQTVRAVRELQYAAMGTRTMDLRVQPAFDAEGQLLGVLFSAGDITELENSRRALQHSAEQLRAANANLEQFVRIASHDLREPLSTIQQFSTLIEQGPAAQLDDNGRHGLRMVREGAARMRRMLDDVLQFVRLDGVPEPPAHEVPLDELLAEVLAALDARIQATGAKVSSTPLGSVVGHGALLTLLVQNLVANALKFVPPGRVPQVHLSIERPAGEARLTVADNGIGIEAQRLPELGQPFRRLHARRKFDGTGLGLAICMRVAQQHGGRIEISSTPGEGSRFTLVLPER